MGKIHLLMYTQCLQSLAVGNNFLVEKTEDVKDFSGKPWLIRLQISQPRPGFLHQVVQRDHLYQISYRCFKDADSMGPSWILGVGPGNLHFG